MAEIVFKVDETAGGWDHTLRGFLEGVFGVYYYCCPFTGKQDRKLGSLCRFRGRAWEFHSALDYQMVFKLPSYIRETDEVAAKLAIRVLFGDTA